MMTDVVLMHPNDARTSHEVHCVTSEIVNESRTRKSSVVSIMRNRDSKMTVTKAHCDGRQEIASYHGVVK